MIVLVGVACGFLLAHCFGQLYTRAEQKSRSWATVPEHRRLPLACIGAPWYMFLPTFESMLSMLQYPHRTPLIRLHSQPIEPPSRAYGLIRRFLWVRIHPRLLRYDPLSLGYIQALRRFSPGGCKYNSVPRSCWFAICCFSVVQ